MCPHNQEAPLELLEAVEALTKPTIEHHAIKGPDGKWLRTHTVTLDPLLKRLADLADPSNSDMESLTTTGLARVPVNLTAMFEYAKIGAQIRDWCRIRNVTPTRPPHVDHLRDLTLWHESTLADNTFEPDWWVGQLRGWAHLIRGMIVPSKSFEAHYPCPCCGATAWGDAINGGSMWAIEVRYDLEDGAMVNERATCRNPECATVWTGHDAILELAEEQQEKAYAHA